MSIIINYTGNELVDNISQRNALPKFKGMRVRVSDASDDSNLGSGSAEYLWNGTNWDTIWSSLRVNEWNNKADYSELGFVQQPDQSYKLEKANLGSYDLDVVITTGPINLAKTQIAVVNVTTNRTISFTNAPGSNRAMSVLVKLKGKAGTVTWPAGIKWHSGSAPELGDDYTLVSLLWDGTEWVGMESAKA